MIGIMTYISWQNIKKKFPRATSTTRTVFRLNTNQDHAYEDNIFKFIELIF